MFANLLRLISGQPTPEMARQPFIEEVRVDTRERRNPRVLRLLLLGWVLITLKHVLIIWACRHYPVPFHQLWVNFPTWLLGTLATVIYFFGARRPKARTRPPAVRDGKF